MENAFLTRLQAHSLYEHVVEVRGHAGEITIEVTPGSLHAVLLLMKQQFGFNYLCDITAADHYSEKGRFELCYNIVNLDDAQRLRISCRLEEDAPEADSAIDIWGSAEWYEREAWDMMGIRFRNHPDMRRMYMPEDFQYHPLRKEFPQLGIPGTIQVPEKDPPKPYK